MFSVGDKVIYCESGVCTVAEIAPLSTSGTPSDRLYYHLVPLVGSGTYYSPIDSGAFMRSVITKDKAEALIESIPAVEPAICMDSRFNHVDAFYKEIFKLHTPESMVSVIKGLRIRTEEKKTKSSRVEMTMKRAKEILYGELSVALGIDFPLVEDYIIEKVGMI